MRMPNSLQTACCALTVVVLAGCGTTSGGGRNQMESTVYDTHRRVVKLDSSLGDTLTKLNETTAELIQRVNESDETSRRLVGLVEENQVKIDRLQKDMTDLKTAVFRQYNLTMPGSGASMSAPPSADTGVTILPPPSGDADMAVMDEVSTAPAAAAPVDTAAPAAATPSGNADEHYKAAQRDYANEKFTEALAAFNEHLAMWPSGETTANALFWKGKCHLKLGQYNEAIADFDSLAKQHASSTKVPFALHNQAVAYSNLGKTAEAEQLLSQVITNYPVSPAAEQARMDLEKLKAR